MPRAKGFDDPRPRKPWPDYERDWPRLVAKVIKRRSGCWEWQAFRKDKGYGQFGIGRKGLLGAHVASYILANRLQKIPESLCVLHRCDNPPCINPDHLFLGTKADNNRDMRKKGRGKHEHLMATAAKPGEDHYGAKLTEKQVIEIRKRRQRERGHKLALEFGVTDGTISAIVYGRIWGHAGGPLRRRATPVEGR